MQTDTLISKIAAGLKSASAAIMSGIVTLSQKYFLQITYVTIPQKDDLAPVQIKSFYLNYDQTTGKSKVVEDIKDATCIDFTLGALIIKKLREQVQDKQLQYDLISCGDAALMDQIQNKT